MVAKRFAPAHQAEEVKVRAATWPLLVQFLPGAAQQTEEVRAPEARAYLPSASRVGATNAYDKKARARCPGRFLTEAISIVGQRIGARNHFVW